jgi:hypothetical protein
MAKYSMKQGGKEVGPASVYAEPHTMQGKKSQPKPIPVLARITANSIL